MVYIDGNNVIGDAIDLVMGERASEAHLIDRITRWADLSENKVILVFDGYQRSPWNSSSTFVSIEYPQYHQDCIDADDVIIKLLRDQHGAQAARLVTNDRELIRRAQAVGVRMVMSSEQFLQQLGDVETEHIESFDKPEPPQSEAETAEWAEYFGYDVNLMDAPTTLPDSKHQATEILSPPERILPDNNTPSSGQAEWDEYTSKLGVRKLK